MQSKIIFVLKANGNLEQVITDTDVIYQGQVGTVEYRLEMSPDTPVDEAWKPSDVVFLALTRPDGQSSQISMTYKNDGWEKTSNGWESDVEVADPEGSDLLVSFIARRYSSDFIQYATKTTQQAQVRIMPSQGYTPLNLSHDDADLILATLGDLAGKLESISTVLVDFTVDPETGVGTKFYSNGTTATVNFPTGGGGGGPSGPGLTVLTFDADTWVDGELAFSSVQTGQTNNSFISIVERAAGSGYEQTANKVFKGSDGSILLSDVMTPFAGRVLIAGQINTDIAGISAALEAILGV